MKVIEYWSDRGFNIVIAAEFIKDGHEHYSLTSHKAIKKDLVKLYGVVYNPFINKEYSRTWDIVEYVKVLKHKWFRDHLTEQVSLAEAFEENYAEMVQHCKDYITRQLYSKNVTDGLPDSLKNI